MKEKVILFYRTRVFGFEIFVYICEKKKQKKKTSIKPLDIYWVKLKDQIIKFWL